MLSCISRYSLLAIFLTFLFISCQKESIDIPIPNEEIVDFSQVSIQSRSSSSSFTIDEIFDNDFANEYQGLEGFTSYTPDIVNVKGVLRNSSDVTKMSSFIINNYGLVSWASSIQNEVKGKEYTLSPILDFETNEISAFIVGEIQRGNAKVRLIDRQKSVLKVPATEDYFKIFDYLLLGKEKPGDDILGKFPPQCPPGCEANFDLLECVVIGSVVYEYIDALGFEAIVDYIPCGGDSNGNGGGKDEDKDGNGINDPLETGDGQSGVGGATIVWIPNRPASNLSFPWPAWGITAPWLGNTGGNFFPPENNDFSFPPENGDDNSGNTNDPENGNINLMDMSQLYDIQSNGFISEYGLAYSLEEFQDVVSFDACGEQLVADFHDCSRYYLIEELTNSFSGLSLTDEDKWFVFDNFQMWKDLEKVLDEENGNDYSLASVEILIKLARLDLLDSTLEELEHLETVLDQVIGGSLSNHNLEDRLVISSPTWFMIMQTEAGDNGGGALEWLRAEIRSIREGFIELLQPLGEQIDALFESLPQNKDEWYVMGATLAPILGELALDFVPIVGDVKGFADAFEDAQNGNYISSGIGFIGSLAGILPIGDLIKSIPKVKDAMSIASNAFNVLRALKNVSASLFKDLVFYVKNGFKAVWDSGTSKLKLLKGTDEVGEIGEGMARAMGGLNQRPDWIRSNSNLLSKLSTESDEFIAKIDNFYKFKLQQPALAHRTPQGPPPYKARSTHANPSLQVDVDYDEFRFPKFESFSPGSAYYAKTDNLVGNTISGVSPHPDNLFANNQYISNFGSDNIQILHNSGSPVLLKVDGTWKKYTWHHHQDGKTMMPVLSDVHNFSHHTGGSSIIGDGVHHFFNSPN